MRSSNSQPQDQESLALWTQPPRRPPPPLHYLYLSLETLKCKDTTYLWSKLVLVPEPNSRHPCIRHRNIFSAITRPTKTFLPPYSTMTPQKTKMSWRLQKLSNPEKTEVFYHVLCYFSK